MILPLLITLYLDPVSITVTEDTFKIKLAALLAEVKRISMVMMDVIEDRKAVEFAKLGEFYDAKFIPMVSLEAERREELIARLEDFILKYPESRVTPLAMLRLAELYFEKANEEHLARIELAIRRGEPLPPKDYSKTVEIYKEFLKRFPDHPKEDVILYLLGYSLSEMGEIYDAVVNYFEKLSELRLSPLAAEAAMRCGEFWFDAGELERAKAAYEKVLDFPQSPFYSKAMYKLAWTLFRIGDYQLASDYFVEAINVSREKEVQLRDEAIQYLIASVVEMGGPRALSPERRAAILAALRVAAKNPEIFFLKSTADFYLKRGQYPEAYEAYTSITEKFYMEPESIDAVFGQVKVLKKIPDIPTMFSLMIKIAEKWGPKSEWAQKNPVKFRKFKNKIEKGLLEAGKFFHEKAQKGERVFYDKALKAYRKSLELFPDSPNAVEANFLLAEILFAKEKYYPEAYMEYKKVVENVAASNKYVYDAAWGMVISADEALKDEMKKEEVEALRSSAYLFERLFPLDKNTPVALYKVAKVLAREKRYEEALRLFGRITERYFTSKVAKDAVMEVAKIYADTERYEEVIRWVDDVLPRKEIVTDEMRKELKELAAGALFKIAKKKEKKDKIEASKIYKKVFEKYPKTNPADNALYNAIVLLREAGMCKESIDTVDTLVGKYPESQLIVKSLFEKGLCYSKLFMFDKAEEVFLKIAMEFREAEESKQALFNSAKIAEGLGDWEKAGRLFIKYYERYGKDEKKPEAYLFRAAYNFKEAGNIQKAIEIFERYVKETKGEDSKTLFAKFEIAKTRLEEGERTRNKKLIKRAKNELKKIIEMFKKIPDKKPAIPIVAEAKFILAKDVFEKFESVKLIDATKSKRPQKALAKLLEKKAKLLKEVQKTFIDVAAVGDPNFASAALFYMAYAFQKFAEEAMDERLVPKGLTEEERIIYQEELASAFVYPMEDKAREIYARNIEKAREIGISNKWLKISMENIKKLDPAYPIEAAEDMIAEEPFSSALAHMEKVERKEAEIKRVEKFRLPTKLKEMEELKKKQLLSFANEPVFVE